MTKKLISGSCLFLVTILLLQVYQELVLLPRQTVTYQISMISYFLMFFGVELLYVCLGFLMTTMIRSHLERKVYWRIGLWMGLIPIILFVMMNLIYWMTLGSKDPWILSLRDVLYRCLLYFLCGIPHKKYYVEFMIMWSILIKYALSGTFL